MQEKKAGDLSSADVSRAYNNNQSATIFSNLTESSNQFNKAFNSISANTRTFNFGTHTQYP